MASWAIIATIVLFLFGIAILALASNYLVTALVKISEVLHIPQVVVGAVILGLGTSLPELSNSLMSVAKGITDLGIGNLIGAAATDLTLALGLVYVIAKKEKVKDKMNWILMGFIAAAMVLLLIFGRDNLLARWEGALMLGVYTIYQIIILRKGFQSNSNKFSTRKLIVPYVLVPLSLISILLGAFLVVDTGIALATLAGISAAAIGLTVVSIGTTAPELIEGVISARSGHKEMAVGSVLGGAVVCTLLILSLTAAIFSLKISYSSFIFPSIFVLALVAYNVIYTAIRKQTDKILGASLIAAYFGYLAIVLI